MRAMAKEPGATVRRAARSAATHIIAVAAVMMLAVTYVFRKLPVLREHLDARSSIKLKGWWPALVAVVVPILRAGLGMLDGMTTLLPTAEVGFLGLVRNEETLEATTYANRLPDDLSGRQVYVVDPMLATGGTLAATIDYLVERGADDITAVVLIAAPEGLAKLEELTSHIEVPITLVTGAMDEKLNENGYIVPGLGDAGDRLFGTKN